MDILSQYKQDHPEAFREKKSAPATDEYGREYRGMIAFIIRLSGGRIKDARQASYMLLFGAGLIVLIALLFYFWGSSGTIKQPASDLINRSQPQQSLPR